MAIGNHGPGARGARAASSSDCSDVELSLEHLLDHFEAVAQQMQYAIDLYRSEDSAPEVLERLKRAQTAARRGASIVRDRLAGV